MDYTALPQRAPRERRSSKRAKMDADADAQCADDPSHAALPPQAAVDAGARDAALAAASEQHRDQQDQQLPLQADEQAAGEGAVADDTPAAAQLDLPVYRSAAVRGHKFEYLDHTADVQLHAWGETLREAFENVALCMFNYMTPLKGISVDPALTRRYEAEGHDLQSLLFNFLDELLFAFSTEFFVPKALRITRFDRGDQAPAGGGGGEAGGGGGGEAGGGGGGEAGGEGGWRIEAEGEGDRFDRQRHACGTEVKAITYSAMQINESPGDAEVFVIVDI